MNAVPAVTSMLLADLHQIALRENLTPCDPWEGGPDVFPEHPDGVARVVVLRLDGTLETQAVDDSLDWATVAGFRFETPWGLPVEAFDVDDYEGGL
ncbi:MAG TPA: hypothetical protein VGB70_12790 [Allosphingosinicella sp.]|jgi:hypothetical protein